MRLEQTNKQTSNKQTNKQTNKRTNKQTNKQTHKGLSNNKHPQYTGYRARNVVNYFYNNNDNKKYIYSQIRSLIYTERNATYEYIKASKYNDKLYNIGGIHGVT